MKAFTAGLFASALMVGQAMAQDMDIAGDYRVEGRNPNGSTYSGALVLTQSGPTVQVGWTVGNDTFNGSGTLEGRVLTVIWQATDPVIYVVMDDGELHGTWADGAALEKAVPVN